MRRSALLPVILVISVILLGACGGSDTGDRDRAPAVPSTAIPSTQPIAGAVLVTRANDRGTVAAKVGDRIQIALGTEFDWRLDPPDGVVLTRGVQNELLVRGTQAVWTAAAPGRSTVRATGTVVCPSGQACIQIAILFTTTVVIGAP